MTRPKSGIWSRREEPPWHDSNVLLTLAADLAVSNLAQVQAAFSSGTRATTDLIVFRNYFAHRNRSSLVAATSLANGNGVSTSGTAAQMLLRTPVGRNHSLLEEWISDLEFIAEFVCE